MASPSPAFTFGQQEIDQKQIIAIARPYGDNQYDLLILQQIPGKQQCWSESGSNPVIVEPLLLNFDFTGICERSTDSNGYSIRIDGQDYGLDYLLRIVQRNGELVLVGTHRTDSRQPEIVVGRTHGLGAGFLKISLLPGWQFTKRTYEGQVLSHVYLTGERSALQPLDNSAETATAPEMPPGEDSLAPTDAIQELTFTAGESSSPPPSVSPSPTPPPPPTSPTPSASPTPATPTLPSFSQLPPLPPPKPAVNSEVVPPPPPNATANANRQGLSDVLSVQPRPLPGSSSNGSSRPDSLAVPAAPLPSGGGYRVMVAARDRNQQSQVRSLYPDAFPTNYNGRSLWQVGVFSSRDNADSALQSLETLGLEGLVIQQ
jgi:hypothetical protein